MFVCCLVTINSGWVVVLLLFTDEKEELHETSGQDGRKEEPYKTTVQDGRKNELHETTLNNGWHQ